MIKIKKHIKISAINLSIDKQKTSKDLYKDIKKKNRYTIKEIIKKIFK